jgi:hypothetical protein
MRTDASRNAADHRHDAVIRLVLGQRHGVPFELRRIVCSECGRVLAERPVRPVRALAA